MNISADQLLLFRLAVMLIYFLMFAEASLAKLIPREVPDWFRDQFKDTWLGRLAPAPLLFWPIALFELAIAGLFGAALVTMEFMPGAELFFAPWGCLASMLLFAGLCLGCRVSYDFAGAASSFSYSALSGLLWYLLLLTHGSAVV